jgi:HEAT repeat protein
MAARAGVRRVAPFFKDSDKDLRRKIVTTLGASGDPAYAPLLAAAAHDDATCRRQAILALGQLAFPEAVEFLQGFARASDPQAVKEARDALKKLATEFPSALPANAGAAAAFVYPRQALFLDREPRTAKP